MPRVNRDISRRLASRRDRDRRRVQNRQYEFNTPVVEDLSGESTAVAPGAAAGAPGAAVAATRQRVVKTATPAVVDTEEYDHVIPDLKRVAVVVGLLLALLIALALILAH